MEYIVVLTREELAGAVDHYSSVDAFSFDVETVGEFRLDPLRNHVLWLSMASPTHTHVFPLGHPNGELVDVAFPLLKSGLERQAQGKMLRKSDFSVDVRKSVPSFSRPPAQLGREEVLDALAPVFASSALKIGHNVKFDINSLSKYFFYPLSPPFFDTQTAEWVLDSSLHGQLKLADCARRRLGVEMEKGVGAKVEAHSFWDVADYAAMDARVTFNLWEKQERAISDQPEAVPVIDLEMLLIPVLSEMEQEGVAVDTGRLKEFEEELLERMDDAVSRAYKAAGRRFNVNSVQEKQRMLFSPRSEGGQGLKGRVLTDAGLKRQMSGAEPVCTDYSTSAEALAGLKNPLVVCLREYSRLTKLHGTYVRPYLGGEVVRKRGTKMVSEWVEPRLVDGRIHTRFVQDRAETGRLSSRDPNLMNVPARTEDGKKIRSLFVASEGCSLVQADFSQIEPRIIADLSGDPILRQTYLDKGDVYVVIADRLGVDRSVGKTLVLSIAYGIGAQTIADRTGMTKTAARELMTFFSAQFPRILSHKQSVLREVRSRRPFYSETVLGRKRFLPAIASRDEGLRAQAERRAYNHLVQGSAADVMKVALVRVGNALRPGMRMILTVHDEIVLDVKEGLEDEAASILKRNMEAAGRGWFSIPLTAETVIAKSWGECK